MADVGSARFLKLSKVADGPDNLRAVGAVELFDAPALIPSKPAKRIDRGG